MRLMHGTHIFIFLGFNPEIALSVGNFSLPLQYINNNNH